MVFLLCFPLYVTSGVFISCSEEIERIIKIHFKDVYSTKLENAEKWVNLSTHNSSPFLTVPSFHLCFVLCCKYFLTELSNVKIRIAEQFSKNCQHMFLICSFVLKLVECRGMEVFVFTEEH